MNAAEKIEAAIRQLEWLQRAGEQWLRYGPDAIISEKTGEVVARYLDHQDAQLILTLHRTLGMQVQILRSNLGGALDLADGNTPDEPASVGNAIALAEEILGLFA